MSEDATAIPHIRGGTASGYQDRSKNRIIQEIRSRPGFQLCLVLLGVLIVVAALAPVIVPYNPNETSLPHKNEGPSPEHIWGTDYLGRDLFSRTLCAAQTSLIIAFLTVGCAFAAGTVIGCIAAYYGGIVDELVSRCIDLFLAFPGIIFSLALLGLIGAGILNMVLALTLSQWASFARLMRGDVLAIRNLEYVQSARTAGLPDRQIILRHLIPNAIMPVLVLATLDVGHVILATSGLSFLGLGIPPGIPEWGSMVGAGKEFLRTAPLNIIVPGLAIAVVVLLFNVLGEGLRDILDVHKDQVNIA
ncbi:MULTISPECIES: ABC transporter permease [unclassified Methanoregula]|uniref:ABC transporter permease n=1 Tax=unclassified Methanoregula TaxID=2649730 RepID=UPI0009CB3DDA|nr:MULTISPECIES: ABC transporter permease [unclassified Methanoregula]OPX64370.1 MAG: nickel transporter permease NikC [Methanoregula sp. PtaB.Bin085]OPY34960.1 MAG: nickel transporter permease NikC [Methanoregula sp. PtaU1.Bin006]